MDKATIQKEIITIINSIQSQTEATFNHNNLSQEEIETLLHKVEQLYQRTIVLNHLNSLEQIEGYTPVHTEAQEAVNKDKESEIVIQKEESVNVSSVVTEAAQQEPVKLTPLVTEKTVVVKAVAFPDLKPFIGLNDKFQFTNELFKGNMQEFNIAIEQLNAAETIESAMNYLESLKKLYDWTEEQASVKRLIEIVASRYRTV